MIATTQNLISDVSTRLKVAFTRFVLATSETLMFDFEKCNPRYMTIKQQDYESTAMLLRHSVALG